jgi:serine/threonine protein kinase/tetratricopeptide (TPR) repeat protein
MSESPKLSAEELFDKLRRMSPDDREQLLAEQVDEQVVRKVRQWLGALELAASSADGASPAFPPPTRPRLQPAEVVGGKYVVGRFLGAGGFSEVYRAKQVDPVVRPVALKLIREGRDSAAVLRRFDRERQFVATMLHPNIAQYYDAGSDKGRPYFVMEYVPGKPLVAFAEEEKVSITERLKLFVQACDAIAYAHAREIIHRDVKPSNLLAHMKEGRSEGTRTPTLKVIDFGIATALAAADRTQTSPGDVVGTPQNMSPEQARGGDVDGRTDVYSLGVVLYELLAGAPPFDFGAADDAQVRRMIEAGPRSPKPSEQFGRLERERQRELAHRRGSVDVQTVLRQLRELDGVVEKAMRLKRDERYASVAALKADVERFLSGDALEAAPKRRGYRLVKWVRRRRSPVAVAAVAALLLVLVLCACEWSLRSERARSGAALARAGQETARADDAAREAESLRAEKQAVLDFVIRDILDNVGPQNIRDGDVRDAVLRIIVQGSAAAAPKRFAAQPRVLASVQTAQAMASLKLGKSEEGLKLAESALRLSEAEAGADAAGTLDAVHACALALHVMGGADEAEKMSLRALEGRRRLLGPRHVQTLESMNLYAAVIEKAGRVTDAARLYRDAADAAAQTLGPDAPVTLELTTDYAKALLGLGRFAEAEVLLRRVVDTNLASTGPSSAATLAARFVHAISLTQLGRWNEAEAVCRQLHDAYQKTPDAPEALGPANNWALVLLHLGRAAEAEPVLRRALDAARKELRPDAPNLLIIMDSYAEVLQELGRGEEAAPMQWQVVQGLSKQLGASSHEALAATSKYLIILNKLGRWHEAEAIGRPMMNSYRQSLGSDHPDALKGIDDFACTLDGLCAADPVHYRWSDADALHREAVDGFERALGPDHPDTLIAMMNYAEMLRMRNQGHSEKAERLLRDARARATSNPNLGPDHPLTLRATEVLASSLDASSRTGEAQELRKTMKRRDAATTRPSTQQAALPSGPLLK